MEKVFAIVSVLFIIAAEPPYIIDTLRGKTKPERATWFIFSVLATIGFVSQLLIEPNWALVFLGLDLAANLLTLVLSLKHGVGGWTLLDRYALAVATGGVVFALLAREPVIALLGIIVADLSGMFLTFWKTLKEPGSETTISWLFFGIGGIFGILSIGSLKPELLIWPVYLVIACFSVPLAQLLGRTIFKKTLKT